MFTVKIGVSDDAPEEVRAEVREWLGRVSRGNGARLGVYLLGLPQEPRLADFVHGQIVTSGGRVAWMRYLTAERVAA